MMDPECLLSLCCINTVGGPKWSDIMWTCACSGEIYVRAEMLILLFFFTLCVIYLINRLT